MDAAGMNLRLLLPRWLRYKLAGDWIQQAEFYEEQARDPDGQLRSYHGYPLKDTTAEREAMRCYLRAIVWCPLEYPHNLPPPENLSAHHADELLYADRVVKAELPCVICGEPTRGVYCPKCL
jgi:hypothetical protein